VIGRSRAVADFGRIQLQGFPAWLLWSLVHLFLLAGFRNRVVVYLNWSWAWFTYGRGARLITGASHGTDPTTRPGRLGFRSEPSDASADRHKNP
jgi:NADH:ubiquinone reductase (H+-translocating)